MYAKLIVPVIIAAFIIWRIYARTRRMFGRQRVQPRRMRIRITMLALVGSMLLLAASHDIRALAGLLAGGACGALAALAGLRYTRFETTAEGSFYTPHAYIGLAVTALFLGRLAYDFMLLSHGLPSPAADGVPPAALAGYNPLTLSVSGLFIAYYLGYYLGVLRKGRQPAYSGPTVPSDPQ